MWGQKYWHRHHRFLTVGAIATMQLASYDNSMPDVSHISEDYESNKYAH